MADKRHRYLTYGEVTKPARRWSMELNMSYATFLRRLNLGWSLEKIATTPVREKKNYKKKYIYRNKYNPDLAIDIRL